MKKIIIIAGFLLLLVLYSFAGWVIETVDSIGDVGLFTSIALDSSNNPHISYCDLTNYDLKYARYNGSNWLLSTVDSFGWVGFDTSIALDSSNNPHISYVYIALPYDYGILKFAHYNGSSWQISTVDSTTLECSYTSIALDNSNNPHISYSEDAFGFLKYAQYEGSNWQISILDQSESTGVFTSLSFDSSYNPHIAYRGDTHLKYAYLDGSIWQISTVDANSQVGYSASLALDSKNNPHISYYDEWNHDLKYAYYDGLNWLISVVDSDGEVGVDTSLALDSTDNPHISYWNISNYNLQYAYYNGASWQISTIDSEGDVGRDNSIALDSDNNSHISYYDETNGALKYAHYIYGIGVSLLSFTAQPQPNSSIKLLWQVSASDDTQIVGFNLYRADAGKARKKDWTRLNHSPIAGNNPYQYVDSSVQAGQDYRYRLSALSADGKEEMLGTTQGEAGTTPAQFALTAVYPNPAISLLTCRLTMPQAGSVTLGLYDMSGRLVLSQRLELASGEQEAALEVGNLARGIYTVRATSSGVSVTKRIVVMR